MNDQRIRDIVEQVIQGYILSKKGVITSYDPAKHMAKVSLQPEGLETGWLQIATMLVGNGFGISFGLDSGMEVLCTFEDGYLNSGVIIGALYSSESPYPAKPNSLMVTHESGSYLRLFNDGTVQLNASSHLFLKSDSNITFSAPGAAVFNFGTLQQFISDTVPGGSFFNSALHVNHQET